MRAFGDLVYLEIKLTLRSKSFLLLAILAIISVQLPPITMLFSQFLLIYQFTRDNRTKFSLILNTLPHVAARLYMARIAAALIVLLSLWPFMLINLAILPELHLAKWLFKPGLISFLTLKYMLLCFIQVSLAFFLCLLTRYLLWLYFLVTFLVWNIMGFLASNLYLLSNSGKLFIIVQSLMLPNAPSLAVGFFPERDLFISIALFQAGLALLLISISIVWHMLQRNEPILRSKFVLMLTFITLIALFSGSQAALNEFNNREHGYRQLLTAAKENLPIEETAAKFEPESYNLSVKLTTNSHYFEGTAEIRGTTKNFASNKIYFTLRDLFTVTAVKELSTGQPLKWSQNGAALLIRLPDTYPADTPLALSISYEGNVWEWFPDIMAKPSGPVNFIATPYSLLRSGYAWYPIPNLHSLYTYCDYVNPITGDTENTLQANPVFHPPMPFTMTVDIDTDQMVVSNLDQVEIQITSGQYKKRYCFYSENGHDVFLLSGPYERQIKNTPTGQIITYSLSVHLQETDRVIRSLDKFYQIYADLLCQRASPAKTRYSLVEIPPFLLFSQDGRSLKNLTLTDTVTVSENYFNNPSHTLAFLDTVQENKLHAAILQRFWQQDFSQTITNNEDINDSIFLYLYLFGLEKNHSPEFYLEAKKSAAAGGKSIVEDFRMPFLLLTHTTREVFLTLDTLRTEFGEHAIKKIMRRLYSIKKQEGRVQATDFTKAVESVLASSGILPEKEAEIKERLQAIELLATIPKEIETNVDITLFAFDMEEYLP
jgi:hypothetical protein